MPASNTTYPAHNPIAFCPQADAVTLLLRDTAHALDARLTLTLHPKHLSVAVAVQGSLTPIARPADEIEASGPVIDHLILVRFRGQTQGRPSGALWP